MTTPPRGVNWLTTAVQVLAAVATIALAFASFLQIRQASRSADAMERANRTSVAIARSAAAPGFALTFAGFDSMLASGDSATCWLHLRVQNDDTKPIRVVSLYCRVDSSWASMADHGLCEMDTGTLIAVGDTTDFLRSVRVGLPKNYGLVSWLHVCAALRRDGPVGTIYVERVYTLLSVTTDVHPMTSYTFEYTGIVNGLSVQLDPWSEPRPDWPWRNTVERKHGANAETGKNGDTVKR